jgi:alpha-L-arabinofuranosidase
VNRIKIDLDRTLGAIDRNIFGGFAEHLGRCIYGGIYDPESPLADENGLRQDVMAALRRLNMPLVRYPGGNFASGYRWRDGVGLASERQSRTDLAWQALETNQFGTNEFVRFCRQLNAEPYLVVNCGDGDMREACDWVEYCNGTQDSAPVKLRRQHGFPAPHQVKYWGIGNEMDGPWEIGFKTPQEYARIFTEFAKVMKWVDPGIKLIASVVSDWQGQIIERAKLIMEQAGDLVDYLSLHWYIGNPDNNFTQYMGTSELLEQRLSAFEGLIKAVSLERKIDRPIPIAVDEWNVWYRTHPWYGGIPAQNHLEEIYNLEDALVVAMNLNAFIRHARWVKMANIAQIVNVIAPIFTQKNSLVLQTIFYPFELYSSSCGKIALDVAWEGDTFTAGENPGVRYLDVAATLDSTQKRLVVFVVNRSLDTALETEITLAAGTFSGPARTMTVNGPDIKAENTFEKPDQVRLAENAILAEESSFFYNFEPHSVTALICEIV